MNAPTIFQSLNIRPTHELASVQSGCLVPIYPPDAQLGLVNLTEEQTLIGRITDCHLMLDDDSVSRNHAEIVHNGSGYSVRDLGSTNGTFVNNRQIESVSLRAGDRVRFGNQIFKFLSANDIEAQYHDTVFNLIIADGLTGAYNKKYFLDAMDREVSRSKARAVPLSLLMMDIDHFKSINDTYGHLTGDQVLQLFVERTRRALIAGELLARYGGEEFAVILTDATTSAAVEVAESIRHEITSTPFATAVGRIPVTASIGVATIGDEPDVTVRDLIGRADSQLYVAKRSGRDQVVCDADTNEAEALAAINPVP